MVIVGTDFSATSALAMAESRALAGRLGAPFEIVHVRPSPRVAAWEPDAEERAWMEAAGIDESRIIVRRGTPWVELVRVAGERGADFIVVGTHGRSGFQPVALGSTAARLALLSPRPILLVGGREGPGAEAVAAGQGSTVSPREAVGSTSGSGRSTPPENPEERRGR